jgi:hypothetical protein
LRICYAFKSRSPKEIYKLFYFAMDHPELDVDVPQDLARCAADLAKMRRTKGSDWQKCRDKLYDYIGGNVLVILADFDELYKRSPEDDLSWGHTHTHTYMQDARRAVEEPVHPPTPAPHHTHTTPNPPLLTPPLNQSPHLLAAWDNGENAENAQEKAEDGGVRMGGDADGSGGAELIASQDDRGGGTELFASQHEPHEEDAGDLTTAEEGDGRPTHSTHTHVTHTYMQDAWKAAEGPLNPLTPIPHQPHTTPPSPTPHTRAAESAAPAVSEPLNLTRTFSSTLDAQRACTHASCLEADFSNANASVVQGPQENVREARSGGDADGCGGAGFITSQDEPHEGEPAIDQASAEGKEEQDPGEWVAEEDYEEDEEVPVTKPGGPEGRNERDEPHEEDAGDQASAEEEEEQDSGEWAAEEEWRRREQRRECVSTDRDEELSDVQDSDEEELNKRSERRFGYNPDNDDAWAEYQAVMEDDLFAW